MEWDKKDRELGMHRAITRRDFLNGAALGAGGVLAADPLLLALMAEDYAPEKALGCQTIKLDCLLRPAARKYSAQSSPGAIAAKSACFQVLLAL